MKFSTRPLVIIGLAIFAYIIYNIGIDKAIATIANMNMFYFAIALLVPIPAIIMKSLRWKYIVKFLNTEYNLSRAIKTWLIGSAAGIVTPGHLGDFFRSFYLHRDTKMSLGKSFSTAVIDRVFDIAIMLLFATFGIFYILINFSVSVFTPTILIVFAFFGFFVLAIIRRRYLAYFLRPFFNHNIPKKYKNSLRQGFNEFYGGLKIILNPKKLALLVALSIVAWLISIAQGWVVMKAFGVDVPFVFLLAVLPIEVLVSLLPITIAGFGTRELTFIFFFSLINVPANIVLAFSLVSVFLVWITVVVGFALWFRDPVKIKL